MLQAISCNLLSQKALHVIEGGLPVALYIWLNRGKSYGYSTTSERKSAKDSPHDHYGRSCRADAGRGYLRADALAPGRPDCGRCDDLEGHRPPRTYDTGCPRPGDACPGRYPLDPSAVASTGGPNRLAVGRHGEAHLGRSGTERSATAARCSRRRVPIESGGGGLRELESSSEQRAGEPEGERGLGPQRF